MNKLQKTSLAIIIACGMASAQLWTVDAPNGQVQFDWIQDCYDDDFDETDENDPCYKTLGGWWFGFVAHDTKEKGENPSLAGPYDEYCKGDKSGEHLKVEAWIKTTLTGSSSWQTMVGPDNANCEGPPVTDKTTGTSLIEGTGLKVRFQLDNGVEEGYWEPTIAALAVNLSTGAEIGDPPPIPRDMEEKGTGFCLTYKSDHGSLDLALELGWDEDEYGYDTWIAPIPPAENETTLDFKWVGEEIPGAGNSRTVGDFAQEGWSAGDLRPGPFPIATAIGEMRAVKIRAKHYGSQETINFELIKFGFAGDCGTSSITTNSPKINSVKFDLVGRTLSMAMASVDKPVSVQIINLHGAVVHTQTLSPNANRINLSNMPTGVYLVRAPSLGYVSKITLK